MRNSPASFIVEACYSSGIAVSFEKLNGSKEEKKGEIFLTSNKAATYQKIMYLPNLAEVYKN